MAWRNIETQDIQQRLTAAEAAMLNSASGSKPALASALADGVAAFNSALRAVGNPVADGQVPDSLRNAVMSYSLWEFLKNFPTLKTFQTDSRRDAYKDAVADLHKLANRAYGAVESPNGQDSAGNWGSTNRIVMRAIDVTPPPITQWNAAGQGWAPNANPNSLTPSVQVTAPLAPVNLIATAVPAHAGWVSLAWSPPLSALSFSLFRGAAAGEEDMGNPVATGLTTVAYVDTGLVSGTPVWYVVAGVNEVGQGANSNEATATPN